MSEIRFNIKEMSEHTGISAHALRYYEKIGLLRDVPRTDSGYRVYSARHIQWITFVKYLRATGMPIRQITKYFDLLQEGDSTILDRLKILEDHERYIWGQVTELQANLEKIRYKICKYREAMSEQAI